MDDKYDRPVSRGDLEFTIERALHKAERVWPKKRVPGDHDRLRPAARRVIEYLELCGIRCFSRAPRPGHSTPDPWGVPEKARRRRGPGAAGD